MTILMLNGLWDHLRDVPWDNIFKISASAAASEFCELVQVELMYISLIISIRSSIVHLHGFQLLVLLPQLIEISFFVCSNIINLVIFPKGFFKLPNLHMLIKQKSPSLPRKLALGNFGKLPKEFCFPYCWKVSLVVHVFKNVGEISIAKNYHPVSPFLWLAKSLKNL